MTHLHGHLHLHDANASDELEDLHLRPALEICFLVGLRLPPPWYLPIEAPACGEELHVPAEETNDGIERHFVCDRRADHEPTVHRQVTDNDEGTALQWSS